MPPSRRLFLKTELEPRLDEAQAGRRAVFFVDAAHFVLGSFLGWLWCMTRVFVRASSGRQRYNVLGAINAVTLELVRVTNEGYITATTVCELLGQIAALNLAVPITVVMDNARYQRCQLVQTLARQLNIELLFLPSYSPNLNLIERLWKFVKKTALNSRPHSSFAEFRGAIDQCLDELPTTHRAHIATLMVPRFQTFEHVLKLAA
jgi:transposase